MIKLHFTVSFCLWSTVCWCEQHTVKNDLDHFHLCILESYLYQCVCIMYNGGVKVTLNSSLTGVCVLTCDGLATCPGRTPLGTTAPLTIALFISIWTLQWSLTHSPLCMSDILQQYTAEPLLLTFNNTMLLADKCWLKGLKGSEKFYFCSPFPLQMTPSSVSQSSLLWASLMSQDLGNWHRFPNQSSSQMHRPHEQ